jgi:uncharacterized OB-fold protein
MSDVAIAKPLPEQTADSASYWRAAAEGRLELTRCRACGNAFHYPRPACTACGSWDVEPFTASGEAEVYSFTVIHRAPNEAFRPDVPYVLALVDTEEGARLLTHIVDVDVEAVRIGQRVAVRFQPRGETAIPVFAPLEADA